MSASRAHMRHGACGCSRSRLWCAPHERTRSQQEPSSCGSAGFLEPGGGRKCASDWARGVWWASFGRKRASIGARGAWWASFGRRCASIGTRGAWWASFGRKRASDRTGRIQRSGCGRGACDGPACGAGGSPYGTACGPGGSSFRPRRCARWAQLGVCEPVGSRGCAPRGACGRSSATQTG